MVIFFCEMIMFECIVLMCVMCDFGMVIDWSYMNFDGLIVDKYFMGGVGDVILLMFGFMVVVCGGYVLMIFGCGFGYIGGMFDKFEVIFGYNIILINDVFGKVIK